MSCVLEMLRARCWPRVAALALTTIGVAACSGDASRFNESPFASASFPEATGSIAQQGAPVSRVESRPLAPQPAPGVPAGSKSAVLQGPTQARANAAAPDATRSVVRKPGANGNWSWDGGTAITVAPGETVDAIARRYGVPASVIMQANNIASPAIIYPGQRLVIPRYGQSPAATAAAPATRPASPVVAAAPATAPAAATSPAGNAGVHVVATGDTLSKIARRYNKPVNEIAKANNIQSTATLNVGDRLVIPGAQAPAVKSSAPAAVQAKPAPTAAVKETEPAQTAAAITPTPDSLDKDAAKLAEGTGALPKFRWPANGRVIAGYGPTPNGQQNDGINIALPENTPVKAAEDGVVAYAGNELKGYGNLVLVRHPNGYVTAYAHAKELLVKRGDQVKRGQVIARSGQTGNVNAPQLHFEIRKGASPLDPTRFLNGA
jgi:murein DD-endopeptidase MepM/ murein hydrolase activator NlpD